MQVVQHDRMCIFHHITTKQNHTTRYTISTTWGSILQFCQDVASYIEANIKKTGECVLLGDLKICVNKKGDQDTIILLNTLKEFWPEFPTH